MARIRSIKPEFPQSESMGRVSRDARLAFIELWTIADDEGRLRGHSRMLASLLFPYDEDAGSLIDTWLGELEREKCIVRYQFQGTSYIQICNWLMHQKIDKPSKSKIPACANPCDSPANPRESSREFSQPTDSPRERSSEDLRIGSKDQGREGKGSPSASATPTRAEDSRETELTWWLDFKLVYPARAGDQGWRKAQRAAHARLAEGHTPDEIIGGAKRYAAFCESQSKVGTEYVKQACTFLGPDKPFLEPWAPPLNKAEIRQNRNLSVSEQWLLEQEAKDAGH